jgi:hypothetical protein
MLRKLLYSGFAILGSGEIKEYEQESRQPRQSQTQRLLQMINANADTIYGQEHSFSSIKSVSDFQKSVPINVYDTIHPYIERTAKGEPRVLTSQSPFMFATTSGTTGARKLIPITRAYVTEFRRASVVSGYNLLKNFPGIARGVSLSVFSAAEEGRTSAGIPFGAITGRLYLEEPKLIKKYISPIPYDVFVIDDYESRYYALLRCALMLPVSCLYTLNPSTIVLIGRRLSMHAESLIKDIEKGTLSPPCQISDAIRSSIKHFLVPDQSRAKQLAALLRNQQFTPDKIWPELSLICCWTRAAAAFYLKDFPQFYGKVPVLDITYGASEGRGTVCLGPDKQGLAIRSHFFEFVPEAQIDARNPTVLLADELEVGKNYYILFTTSGGLYRYNLNDIVKVVGWHNATPLLEFQHKGGNISSFTGEKVTESQVTDAASGMLRMTGEKLRFFTIVPEFRPEPHYQLWMEPEEAVENEKAFAARMSAEFDRQLSLKNVEYKTKRDSQRLAPSIGKMFPPGTYDELRRRLVAQGVPDAQVKISHLNPKKDIREYLESKLLAGAL